MLSRSRRLALLVLAPLLAGCATQGADTTDAPPVAGADWAARALPYGPGHDHFDAAHHKGLSTPNYEVVGWNPLITQYHGRTSGSYECGDAVDTGTRRLAVVHTFTTDVAFVVTDVTDPANPSMIGEFVMQNTHVYDLALTPDARYVVLATSAGGLGPDAQGAAPAQRVFFKGACNGAERRVEGAALLAAQATPPELPYRAGIVLVDLLDPAAPEIVDYRPLPNNGAHSVFATDIGGTPVVLASVQNTVHFSAYYAFYTIEETPLGAKLVQQCIYRPPPADTALPVTNGHVDGWLHEHPVTGATIAYLSDWNGGLVIVDATDLKAPREVSRWSTYQFQDTEATGTGRVHAAYPLPEAWDGRHYTIVGQELGNRPRDTPSGIIYVLDTTDPAAPGVVSAWTFPADVQWDDKFLLFSHHYFVVHERHLFLSAYHAGVWAVDLSDVAQPRSAGVFIPDRVSPKPPQGLPDEDRYAPEVLEVEAMPNGDLVLWDSTSGIYVVRYDATRPAPRVAEWPLTLPSR